MRKKKYRICFLTAGQYPVPAVKGGAVENLVELLISDYQNNYPKDDVDVDVVTLDSTEAVKHIEDKYSNIHFRFIHVNSFSNQVYKYVKRFFMKFFMTDPVFSSSYFQKAKRVIMNGDYDIVVVENKPQFVLPIRRFYKGSIILHLHNDTLNVKSKNAKRIKEACNKVICVSKYIQKRVCEIDLQTVNVDTLYNVIDVNRFIKKDTDANIREKYGFSEEDFVVIYSGRIIPDKGVDKLISAINDIDDQRIKLLIVGGSAYSDSIKTNYEQKCFELSQKNEGRVVFTGYVSYDEMPGLYKSADLAVFPSMWQEPAGLVVVEAQACGLPVIISNSGGMPEYVSQQSSQIIVRGENFLADLRETIIRLSLSPLEAKTMGKNGIKQATNFDKAGYFQKLLSLII